MGTGCATRDTPRDIMNIPGTKGDVIQLCRQLGYSTGSFASYMNNRCPKVSWNGSMWTSKYESYTPYAIQIRCWTSDPCSDAPTTNPTTTPSVEPTRNPTTSTSIQSDYRKDIGDGTHDLLTMENMATTIISVMECDCEQCLEEEEFTEDFEAKFWSKHYRNFIIVSVSGGIVLLLTGAVMMICLKRFVAKRRMTMIEENMGQMTKVRKEDWYE